jgi:hypothetical protein
MIPLNFAFWHDSVDRVVLFSFPGVLFRFLVALFRFLVAAVVPWFLVSGFWFVLCDGTSCSFVHAEIHSF